MRLSNRPMPRSDRQSRPALAAAALVLLLGPGPARAEPARPSAPVAVLLAELASMPGLEARFREEKRIALLEAPLVSEGTLHFAPPGRLARHTLTPFRASLVVADGSLRFGDETGAESLEVEANPTVRLFTEGFLAIFAGDRTALERMYTMRFQGLPAGDWELRLTPREPRLGRIVREIAVRGRGPVLSEMRVTEVSGDETVTTFTEVDTARRYTDAEMRRVFAIPGER